MSIGLKAEKVGLTPTDVFSTLQVYLGSQYVNGLQLTSVGPYQVDRSGRWAPSEQTPERHLASEGP